MLLPSSTCCLALPIAFAFSDFLGHLRPSLWYHLALVSPSASSLGALVLSSQSGSSVSRRFLQYPLVFFFRHHAIHGCPFQNSGEITALLPFCLMFFLKMQLHDFYLGNYTTVGFILLASWFFEHSFRLFAALIVPGQPCEERLKVPVQSFERCCIP